jgi:hypothetical protein
VNRSQSDTLLVSDALGRERAIRIIRDILDANHEPNNDGRAVAIVLALDYATCERL